MTKVAINGLGRIGRATFKILNEHPDLELVAINDLDPTENLGERRCRSLKQAKAIKNRHLN